MLRAELKELKGPGSFVFVLFKTTSPELKGIKGARLNSFQFFSAVPLLRYPFVFPLPPRRAAPVLVLQRGCPESQ